MTKDSAPSDRAATSANARSSIGGVTVPDELGSLPNVHWPGMS
jgi:hypothetical protein